MDTKYITFFHAFIVWLTVHTSVLALMNTVNAVMAGLADWDAG